MTISIRDIIINAVEEKFYELKEIRQKRFERINKAYKDSNNNIPPNEDINGRLHAPIDGYCDIDGKGVFGKGEFLPIPDSVFDRLEMQGITCDRYKTDWRAKCKILLPLSVGEEIKTTLQNDYGIDCSHGATFERNNQVSAYFYMKGNDALINALNTACETITAIQKEEEKKHKGIAPEGKVIVTGEILVVKVIEDYYGRTLKMLLKLENGATVWGTLPSVLSESERGDIVTISATFTHAPDDNTHAFFKRPQAILK